MALLRPGDPFPTLTLPKVGGGTISLPDDLSGAYGVVLVNRGAWCPYCTAQLNAFRRASERLSALGIAVVSFSTDTEQAATELVEKNELPFPVGHSADPDKVAEAIGSFVNPDPKHLQSTGFVLDPDGAVVVSVYSSGAIGRLVPEDVAGLVEYVRQHA